MAERLNYLQCSFDKGYADCSLCSNMYACLANFDRLPDRGYCVGTSLQIDENPIRDTMLNGDQIFIIDEDDLPF